MSHFVYIYSLFLPIKKIIKIIDDVVWVMMIKDRIQMSLRKIELFEILQRIYDI